MRTRYATAAVILALAACSGDGAPAADHPATSRPPAGSAATTTTSGDATTTTSGGDDACGNDLEIAGSDVADGTVDVAMAITDAGPHPANTVDADATLELAIATFEIEADPQFGLGVPVGVPAVPDGEVMLVAYLALADTGGTVEAGSRFVDVGTGEDGDGRIANIALYAGTRRINPLGPAVIEISAIDDEQVCGAISMVGDTDLQAFPTITGTFRADRIQFLEAH